MAKTCVVIHLLIPVLHKLFVFAYSTRLLTFFLTYYQHMPIGKVWIYRLLFVCLCVCTVTDFPGEDKASGVQLCAVVHRRPGQEIFHLGELCSPVAKNRTNRRAASGRRMGMCG